MLNISQKEHEQLKNDVASIKSSIDRYMGYVISVTGISGVIARYLILKQDNVVVQPFSSLIILVALVVVTLLFEVLWYKFKSHNRHLGYMQLLSQESASTCLTEQTLKDKSYLKQKFDSQYTRPDLQDLVTWEFVMARHNNVADLTGLSNILKSTDKIKFRFSIPETFDCEKIENYSTLDNTFFTKCIHPLFEPKKDNLLKKVWRVFVNLLILYRPLRRKSLITKIDSKYISLSWRYPRTLIRIGFLSYIGLSFAMFYCIYHLYDFFQFDFGSLLLEPTIIISVWILLTTRWLWIYIANTQNIVSGKYSIDYYCWLFFIFRVQMLNEIGVVPEYFCRNFRRYLKSVVIYQYAKNEGADEKYLDILKNAEILKPNMREYHNQIKSAAYKSVKKRR